MYTAAAPPPRFMERPVAFPILGAVLVVATTAAAWLGLGLASFGNSVCNADSTAVTHARDSLRIDVVVIGLVAAAVPAGLALIARRGRRNPWPWVVIAGGFAGLGIAIATTIQPAQWCLF
jgi:hypothetical protein